MCVEDYQLSANCYSGKRELTSKINWSISKFLIFFSDVVAQVVVEGVNATLVTQEMEHTAQVSVIVDIPVSNFMSKVIHCGNSLFI